MAFRRRIGGLAQMLLQSHLVGQRQDELARLQSDLQHQRAQEEMQQRAGLSMLESVKSDPSLAYKLGRSGTKIGGVPVQLFAPETDDINAKVGQQIGSAKKLEDLPTDVGAAVRNAAPYMDENKDLETPPVAGGQQFMAPGGQPDYDTRPDINVLMKQRGEKERSILANLQTEREGAAQQAGMVTGAQQTAEEPFKIAGDKRTLTREQTLENQRFGHQKELEKLKIGTNPLPGSEIDTVANLNNALYAGTPIITALKASGLDQSNDPVDPRWRSFMIKTLKMSPSEADDVISPDTMRRAAAVQALMLRGIMGGRPSEYMAKIYMQHLPDQQMSGKLLADTTKFALDLADKGLYDREQNYQRNLHYDPSYKDYKAKEDFVGPQQQEPVSSAMDKLSRLRGSK